MKNCFFKKTWFLALLLLAAACSPDEEHWEGETVPAAPEAALTISYQQRVFSWSSFPGQDMDQLPKSLVSYTIPTRREEKTKLSIHPDGSLEVFVEIIPVAYPGVQKNYDANATDESEVRYIHLVAGASHHYDASMRLLRSYPMELGNYSEVLEWLRENKEALPQMATGLASGNPFILSLYQTDDMVPQMAPDSDNNVADVRARLYTMESDFTDADGTQFRQKAYINSQTQTVHAFETYDPQGALVANSKLRYDDSKGTPQLKFIEDHSLEKLPGGMMIQRNNTTYFENFNVKLNLQD